MSTSHSQYPFLKVNATVTLAKATENTLFTWTLPQHTHVLYILKTRTTGDKMGMTMLTLSQHVSEHARVDRAAPSVHSWLCEAAARVWLASFLTCEPIHEGRLRSTRTAAQSLLTLAVKCWHFPQLEEGYIHSRQCFAAPVVTRVIASIRERRPLSLSVWLRRFQKKTWLWEVPQESYTRYSIKY